MWLALGRVEYTVESLSMTMHIKEYVRFSNNYNDECIYEHNKYNTTNGLLMSMS